MDEFAQTREPDNLFDDDFTPIPPSGVQNIESQNPSGAQNIESQNRPVQHGHSVRSSAPKPSGASANENPDLNTATRPPSAVRGDRSATGGINKPKLTETELSARLAAAKLNNARREEAHRLAEADEASFQKREAQASQKRREEGAARRVMEGEREKNRLRKLGAQGGREWDEGKEEQDTNPSRASQYRRGAHGGISRRGGRQQDVYDDYGREDQDPEDIGDSHAPRGGRSRGRGGPSDRSRADNRGGRGGRGPRGRGNHHHNGQEPRDPPHPSAPPILDAETEFPSLPPPTNPPPHSSSKEPQPTPLQEPPQTLTAAAAAVAAPSAQTKNNAAAAGDGSPARGSWVMGSKEDPRTAGETLSPRADKESWFDQVETQAPPGKW